MPRGSWSSDEAGLQDHRVLDLPDLLEPGDLLVLQRHPGAADPAGRPKRPEHGRGDPARPRAGRALAGVREARAQVPPGRSPGIRAGFFWRGARQGRGGRDHAGVRVRRGRSDPAARGLWRDAAAALHQAAARRRPARSRRLSDAVRAPGGRGRGTDRGAAFHRAADGGAGATRHRAYLRHAACRRRHLPAGQDRGCRGPCDACRVVRGAGRDGRPCRAGAGAGWPRGRGRHHGAAHARERRGRRRHAARRALARPGCSSRRATVSRRPIAC